MANSFDCVFMLPVRGLPCDGQGRLLEAGDTRFQYTRNGQLSRKYNVTDGRTYLYSYDSHGDLKHVQLPDGRAIDYVTDAEGRRVGKKINGTMVRTWLYSGRLSIAGEIDTATNVVTRIAGDAYFERAGKTFRLVRDHFGSVRLVVDTATSQVVQRIDFDEFGRVTLDTNPGFQPYGFAGGLYDSDTGLVHFGGREYDAESGRWTRKDPIRFGGDDTNLWAYVANDPINRVDRTGLRFVPSDSGTTAALANLAADPVLGPAIDLMERSPTLIFVNSVDPIYEQLKGLGGAGTFRDGPALRVDYNMDYAKKTMKKCGAGTPQSVEQLLAHEFGHVFDSMFVGSPDGGKQSALDFENTQRPWSDQRSIHDCPACIILP